MYSSSLTVGDARKQYFRDSGFDETTYTENWVKLKLGPIPFAFPNTTGRKAAVKLHDLHHVATGYDTSWTGEAEIAAWEIGAGCGRYMAAWVLDSMAMAMGFVPRRVVRAFRRGRRSSSLYRTSYSDGMLAWSVGSPIFRSPRARRLHLATHHHPSAHLGSLRARLGIAG